MVAFGAGRGWPYFDPDYESLAASLNAPRVVIDNATSPDATLIKLDSINRHGILLDVVQVLVDFELFISKAYVSSDGEWFMDVFHVTDTGGNKITDSKLMSHIEEALENKAVLSPPPRRYKSEEETHVSLGTTGSRHTAIELTGPDRPGLLSDICSTLARLGCNVASAEVWTHNFRVAGLIFVEEEAPSGPVVDENRLCEIQDELCEVLRGDGGDDNCSTSFFSGLTHTERRLHQMMSADGYLTSADEEPESSSPPSSPDRKYRRRRSGSCSNMSTRSSSSSNISISGSYLSTTGSSYLSTSSSSYFSTSSSSSSSVTGSSCSSITGSSCSSITGSCNNSNNSNTNNNGRRPVVAVSHCEEKGYSVVSIHCKDRSKLLFDTVCTLTDMDYMIFHATVLSEGHFAYQEFYIRHIDGYTVETEEEQQRLVKCLVAAIERRFSQGLRLELCARDRVGLLSDVTRVFYQHGLSVAAAYVATEGDTAVNTFYVTDSQGREVDMETLETIRKEIGLAMLQVKQAPVCPQLLQPSYSPAPKSWLAAFFRAHSERLLYSLGIISSLTDDVA